MHNIEEDAKLFLIMMDNNKNSSNDCCQETITGDMEYIFSPYHQLACSPPNMNMQSSSSNDIIAKSSQNIDLSNHHDIYHSDGDMMRISCHTPIPSMNCNSDMIDNGSDDLLIIHQCDDGDNNKRTGINFVPNNNQDTSIIHKRIKASNHDMPDLNSLIHTNISNNSISSNNSFYFNGNPALVTNSVISTPDYGGGNLHRQYKGPLVFKPSNLTQNHLPSSQNWNTPPSSNKFYNSQYGVNYGIKINNNLNTKRCSNCGSTNTPSWRRCPKGKDLLCNACGLYAKLHNRPRPFKIGDDGSIRVQRQQMNSMEFEDGGSGYTSDNRNHIIVCANCDTMDTPLWRRGENGRIYCNACALYYRTHNAHRPKQYYNNVSNGINKEPPSNIFTDSNGDYDPIIFSHFP